MWVLGNQRYVATNPNARRDNGDLGIHWVLCMHAVMKYGSAWQA